MDQTPAWLLPLIIASSVVITSPLWGAYLLLKKNSRLRFWAMRLAEVRSFRRGGNGRRLFRSAWGPIGLAVVISWLAAIAVCGSILTERAADSLPGSALLLMSLGSLLVGWLCFASALAIQLVPNADRRLKYTLVLVGVVLFSNANVCAGHELLSIVFSFGAVRRCLAVLLMGPVYLSLVCLFAAWLTRSAQGAASQNLRTLYGTTVGLTPPIFVSAVFLSWLPIVWTACLLIAVLRFLLGERLAQEPIVYLRSFQHDDSAAAYGGMINHVAAQFGVLVGLVHTRQPASELHRRASFFNHAWFQIVPDEWWRDWVTAQLRRSSTVVIDISLTSDSVDWELERALELAPREHILVLHQRGSPTHPPEGLRVITYRKNLGEPDQSAIAAMSDWFAERYYRQADSWRPFVAANLVGGSLLSLLGGAIVASWVVDDGKLEPAFNVNQVDPTVIKSIEQSQRLQREWEEIERSLPHVEPITNGKIHRWSTVFDSQWEPPPRLPLSALGSLETLVPAELETESETPAAHETEAEFRTDREEPSTR